MNGTRKLRGFLISGFIKTIIITSLIEVVFLRVLEHSLFKWIFMIFFGTDDLKLVSPMRLMGIGVVLVLALLFGAVSYMMPSFINRTAGYGMPELFRSVARTLKVSDEAFLISNMSYGSRLILWGAIIASVIIIILPYVIAAFLYARLVIREFREIEEREEAARLEYERKRNLMVSDIAHDLRTPMTTISGYARALEDGLVPEGKRQEIYASIRGKTDRMNELIGFLFDYTKLDSEGFSLHKEKLDICELVRECAATLFPDMEKAGMDTDIDIPEEKCILEADRLQLSRVISNLINNAIKHNSPGTRIGIYLTLDDEIRIFVNDTGELIPEDKAGSVFEPFVMGDGSRNSAGGTGLGLSIARRICVMHGYSLVLLQKPETAIYRQSAGYTKAFVIRIPIL